jgi:hypothetical protein
MLFFVMEREKVLGKYFLYSSSLGAMNGSSARSSSFWNRVHMAFGHFVSNSLQKKSSTSSPWFLCIWARVSSSTWSRAFSADCCSALIVDFHSVRVCESQPDQFSAHAWIDAARASRLTPFPVCSSVLILIYPTLFMPQVSRIFARGQIGSLYGIQQSTLWRDEFSF